MGVRGRRSGMLLRATGAAAALAYSAFLLDAVLPGRHDWGSLVSELEAQGRPMALVLRSLDVASALLALALVPWLRRVAGEGGRWGRWAAGLLCGGVLVFAAGEIGAAIVHLPAGVPDTLDEVVDAASLRVLAHNALSIASIAGMVASGVGAWMAADARGAVPRWLTAGLGLMGAGMAVSFAGELVADQVSSFAVLEGVTQRVQIVTGSVWLACLGVLAAQPRIAARAASEAASASRS